MFDWLSSHWKAVATVAVAAVVFTAVTVATGGLGAPVAAALLAGGFASGVAGYTTSELLDGRTPTVQGALVQGTVAAGLTVATFGVGRVLAPVVAPLVASVLPEAVTSAVPAIVQRTVTNTAVGATFGTGVKVAENAVTGRPLLENTQDAAILGAMSGALVEPTVRAVNAVAPGPRVVAPPPIDPVTQTTMTRLGMTPDTILYRVTEPKWVQNGQISGNPNSMAIVADPYNMVDHPWAKEEPGARSPDAPAASERQEPRPEPERRAQGPRRLRRPGHGEDRDPPRRRARRGREDLPGHGRDRAGLEAAHRDVRRADPGLVRRAARTGDDFERHDDERHDGAAAPRAAPLDDEGRDGSARQQLAAKCGSRARARRPRPP